MRQQLPKRSGRRPRSSPAGPSPHGRRSGAWAEPSLDPFGDDKENDADEDDEADRRIGARQVVALGQFVYQLTEPAKIDEELDADYIDQGKNQAESHADENVAQ